MELREYGRILLSRWWLIILLPLLAGGFTLYQNQSLPKPPKPTYMYDIEYSISFLPMVISDIDQDPRLGAVQVSEYVADDLTEIFKGTRFISFVEQYLDDSDETTAQIAQSIRVAKAHRLVTIVLRANTKEDLYKLADAVKQAVANHIEPLLNELWGIGQVRFELTDDTGPMVDPGSLVVFPETDISPRVALAFLAAVALAFGLEYFDDSIRSRKEVQKWVGPVLAEIPPE